MMISRTVAKTSIFNPDGFFGIHRGSYDPLPKVLYIKTAVSPAAFLSYSHIDDADQRLTEFSRRFELEISAQTGEEFEIFQDRTSIRWGQQWRTRIEQAIDASTLLIAILSPSFFKSRECRTEVERFFAREKHLGRNDLILSLYFIDYRDFDDASERTDDGLMSQLASSVVSSK
jgi:hypothetical protein